jgi:hypothetical protein
VTDVTIRKFGANQALNPDYHFASALYHSVTPGPDEQVIGSGNQLRTVPVGGADTIEITFS